MKRISLVTALACAAAFGGGCSHIPFLGKRHRTTPPGAQKQSKYIARDVEKEFEQRWVEHRTAELVSQGQPQDAAQAQAIREFKAKYAATDVAKQLP